MTGLPVVLKFLKFHRCPEIRNCPEILLIWPECPEIDLRYAVVTALPLFCTLYLFNWTLSVLLAYLLQFRLMFIVVLCVTLPYSLVEGQHNRKVAY